VPQEPAAAAEPRDEPDVVAELDDDEQLKDAADGCGLQQEYLQAVHARLKEEVGNHVQSLLLDLLKENDFWLHAVHAPKICCVLQIELLELSYYRDIYVWLPDVRWGQEAMPPCPNCLSSQLVGEHGWRDYYFGRRISGLVTHYFVISRRSTSACTTRPGSATRTPAKLWRWRPWARRS